MIQTALAPELSDDVVRLFRAGLVPVAIARQVGRGIRAVDEELRRQGGESLWSPDCMSAEDFALWKTNGAQRKAGRPCADCPLGYAAEMRAQGRCNGTPAGVELEEEDEDEAPMQQHASTPPAPSQPTRAPDRRTEVAVAMDLPCAACIHREVCRIRDGLEARLARLPVLLPELDPALTVALEAKVDCSLFRAERPAKRGGGGFEAGQPGRPGTDA